MQLKIPFNVLAGLLAFMGSMAFAQDGQTSRPLVVATIKPLAIIAKSALGESADVEYLQASNQSPHDLFKGRAGYLYSLLFVQRFLLEITLKND